MIDDENKGMQKTNTKTKVILTSIALAGVVSAGILFSGLVQLAPNINSPITSTPAKPGYYKVTYVHDGDTISVNMDGHEEKVRLIGVDTPETIKPNSPVECFGVAASNNLKSLLTNSSVRLEADPINQNRDRYDRLLRYVYTTDDMLVNKQIISEGYGFAYLSFPFSKSEEFRLAQVAARQANKGVWSGECDINGPDSDRPKTNEL